MMWEQFIPSEVINAPRKLTREEFLLMQRHPRLEYELLRRFQDIPEAIRRGVHHFRGGRVRRAFQRASL